MGLRLVSKDLGEIYCRLLDHRPVLAGEINYFLGEFEEKRGNREVHRLQKSLEHVREIDEDLLPKTKDNFESSISTVSANVSTALQMAEMVLDQEISNKSQDWLKQKRTERVKLWTEFMDKMCVESSKVDMQFETEAAAVKKFYDEIEEKLKHQNRSEVPIKSDELH